MYITKFTNKKILTIWEAFAYVIT